MPTNEEINVIAAMHISPSVEDAHLRKPAADFRFFRDKTRLFNDFDPESILLEKNDAGEIVGILIYTHDEIAFRAFSGPKHWRFYSRTLKTLLLAYGFKPLKFLRVALSITGHNERSDVPPTDSFGKIWVLLVMKEHRRRGIAAKLLERCRAEAKHKGTKNLRVTVLKENTPAIKAYEKNGFKTIGSCMESSGDSYVMEKEI